MALELLPGEVMYIYACLGISSCILLLSTPYFTMTPFLHSFGTAPDFSDHMPSMTATQHPLFSIWGRSQQSLGLCHCEVVWLPRWPSPDKPVFIPAASIIEGVVGYSSSLNCSFLHPLTSSVRVKSVQTLLHTAQMVPRFPILSHETVFQKHLGAG